VLNPPRPVRPQLPPIVRSDVPRWVRCPSAVQLATSEQAPSSVAASARIKLEPVSIDSWTDAGSASH